MPPRTNRLNYPVAVKVKAENLYMSGLSITSVWHAVRAMDGCDKITRTTVRNWHSKDKWMEHRASFIEIARAGSRAVAEVRIGRHVELLEEVLDKLREKLKDDTLKAGSIEGVSYAIRTISDSILELTNAKSAAAEKKLIAKRTGEKRVVSFEGAYREEIQSAQEEVSE